MGNDVGAEPGVRFRSGMEHVQFADRLLAVFHEHRSQRPRVAQLGGKLRNPRLFIQGQIGGARLRRIQQLGNGALVHRGVLPHVEAGEMEAEAIHGAAQQPQPSARDHARLVRDQRAVEDIEIGLEFLRAGIGRRFADRLPQGLHAEPHRGRGQTGINAGHRQAIGLAAAMRRGIGRALGERPQIPPRHRQDAPPATVRRRARAVARDRTAARGSTADAACRA